MCYSLIVSSLSFVGEAFAADKVSGMAGMGASLAGFLPLVLIFLVFYFLIIRPQQKKVREHASMVDAVKRGDKIVTTGGIIGEVIKVDKANATFTIEIANGVEIRVKKTAVSEMYEAGTGKDGGGRSVSGGGASAEAKPDSSSSSARGPVGASPNVNEAADGGSKGEGSSS